MIPRFTDCRRLVIKVGSSLLADDDGAIHADWMRAFAEDVSRLRTRGADVMIVSSGAIAVGRRQLGLARGPRNRALKLEESQAAAATGQIQLAHAWQEALAGHGVKVAQVLLTIDDTENRRRYLNARGTIGTLLRLGVVPVINENDTVATEEIRFGDNDRLAGRVAQMMGCDVCLLLTDVDGLYTADPARNPDATHVPEVAVITGDIEAMAGAPRSADGSGGMVTKLAAARIATAAGCCLAIARGSDARPLRALENGALCTWFLPGAELMAARRQWIGGNMKPTGTVVVDAGAARALATGKSLLPAGVTDVDGRFERGDLVQVANASGDVLGRGLSAYSDADARRILGHKSREIERLLGYRGRDEMIHRDDLVLADGTART